MKHRTMFSPLFASAMASCTWLHANTFPHAHNSGRASAYIDIADVISANMHLHFVNLSITNTYAKLDERHHC